jgi:hypothetical protein
MTDRSETFIIDRPMYRVLVFIDGLDVDVQIVLTAKGKRYARGRARGYHRYIESDEDALAEIIHARDNYYPTAPRPDRAFEHRHFETGKK